MVVFAPSVEASLYHSHTDTFPYLTSEHVAVVFGIIFDTAVEF